MLHARTPLTTNCPPPGARLSVSSDIPKIMGKSAVSFLLKKSMDWVRKITEIEDALERGEWDGDDTEDDGSKKETIAQ